MEDCFLLSRARQLNLASIIIKYNCVGQMHKYIDSIIIVQLFLSISHYLMSFLRVFFWNFMLFICEICMQWIMHLHQSITDQTVIRETESWVTWLRCSVWIFHYNNYAWRRFQELRIGKKNAKFQRSANDFKITIVKIVLCLHSTALYWLLEQLANRSINRW